MGSRRRGAGAADRRARARGRVARSQDLEPGEVPELGPEPFLVRRASLVAGGVAFVGVVALLFRILRRRAEVPGKKKKAGKRKDKSGKPKSS